MGSVMTMPSVNEARGRSSELATLQSSMSDLAKASEKGGKQEMTFNLQVDGETIARASHNASEESAGRSFSPIPVFP